MSPPSGRSDPSASVSDRQRRGDPATGDTTQCTIAGTAGNTAETLVVLGLSVQAVVFAKPSDAERSYRDLGVEDLLRCPATPRNVAALGAQAVEADCPAARGGGEYLVTLLDGNPHVFVLATARNYYNAVDHAKVRAALQAVARSALTALRAA